MAEWCLCEKSRGHDNYALERAGVYGPPYQCQDQRIASPNYTTPFDLFSLAFSVTSGMLRFRDHDGLAAFRSITADMARGDVQLRGRLAATLRTTPIGPDNPEQRQPRFLFFSLAP